MKWFKDITNLNELRNAYKKLLIRFHPDNNPDKDTTIEMQEINSEYDALVRKLKTSEDFQYSKAEENFNEDELKRILNELVKFNVDIVIEIIGTWIWIKGNTFPIKSQLKELGFRWSKQKQMWYWGTLSHPVHSPMPMDYIRMKYGSVVYGKKREEKKAIDAYN